MSEKQIVLQVIPFWILEQPVQRLGKQLRKAGTSIAKAEDQEYHQQLDTLLEKVESEELTSLDAEEAVGAIDFWYNLLLKNLFLKSRG